MELEPSTRRLGGVSGVVFVLLYWLGSGLLLGPISQSDTMGQAGRDFADQADTFDVAAALVILSVPFLLIFAQTLWAHLRAAESRPGGLAPLVLVGAAGGAATTVVGAALVGGASFLVEDHQVDGQVAAFSHSVAEACIFYGMTFFGLLALTTAVITFRDAAFPRWFGWTAAVLGTAMVLGSVSSPLVRSFALLAGISTYLFFLVASVTTLRHRIARTSAPLGQPDA